MITKERFEKVINVFRASEEWIDDLAEHKINFLTECPLYDAAGVCFDEVMYSNFDFEACDVIAGWFFEDLYEIHDDIHNTDISIETIDELWDNYLVYHILKNE